MLFRLTYAVRGYQLQYQDSIRVEVAGPHAFVVVLRHEPGEGSASDEVLLEVTGDFDPPRKSAEALRYLEQGLLPDDSRPEDDLASEIADRRLPTSGRSLRFSELPNRLRDYSRDVTRELTATATAIFGLIRWRRAMAGPVEALWARGIEGLEWRDDSGNWQRLPPDFQLSAGAPYILPCSAPDEIADLEALAASGIREPLGHTLLREAQRAAIQREYASALVMGIAALEIGVKELIGTLIPDAEWLVLHAPSPPMFEILRDYLPTIPAHESIGGHVASIPAEILDNVRNGINRRNQTVHTGQGELEQDFIAKVLDAVSDILWMCDYFIGQKWALQNLSDEMQAAIPVLEAVGSSGVLDAAEVLPSTDPADTTPRPE
jgi:hypothetical protein